LKLSSLVKERHWRLGLAKFYEAIEINLWFIAKT
jgi:hypothetical protein